MRSKQKLEIPSKKTSSKASPKQSMHDIFRPKFTDAVSNKNMETLSQQSSFNLDENKTDQQKNEYKSETIEKVLHRLGLQKIQKSKQDDQQLEILVGNIVENCVGTIDKQSNEEHYDQMFSSQYKEALKSKAKQSSIIVNQLNEIEKIELMSNEGLIAIVKQARIFLKKISLICQAIVEHNLFESFILIVIILNSVKMALDDPLTTSDNSAQIQNTFIVLYTIEMTLKIFAYGFLFNQKAYLRDLWNLLDFVIVITSLLPFIVKLGFSVNSLRAIRVLRPLKTITKVKALKMIVSTLFYSFSLVMDSLYILLFVIIVFSIAGTQLFSGVLKNRCIELATGNISSKLCVQGSVCSEGFMCGKGIASPNFSINNFDTFMWSMLNVFQTLTLEGWSQIMVDLQAAYNMFSAIYSLLIVFFCEYVLLNMTMAILKYKYSQVKCNTIEEEEDEITDYEPDFLKKLGIFKSITSISVEPPLERYCATDKIFVGALEFNKNLDNSLSKCIEANFQAPPATRKSLGRIKTLNLSKNKKFDISKLNRGAKIDQYKWDAKTLQFETIEMTPTIPRESVKAIKIHTEEKEEDAKRESLSDASEEHIEDDISIQSFSDDNSDDKQEEIKDLLIDQKIYELQMKLGQSRKNIPENPLNLLGKSNKLVKAGNERAEKKQFKQQPIVLKPEVKQMNYVLDLVNQSMMASKVEQNFKVPNKINLQHIVIPQINFADYKVERLYEKFDDLGEFRIKRAQKLNELNFLNIKHQKKLVKNQVKQQKNMVRQIVEQSSLDIKQLQLINELVKKKMKCRIKQGESLDELSKYDKSRILVFQSMKEEAKKQNQLEQNIKNLVFSVTYKSHFEQGIENNSCMDIDKLGVVRNYDSIYKGLRITQFYNKTEEKQKSKIVSSRSLVSKTANYMKLLQNHKMEQKIEFEQDRIMTIFFKKDREQKQTRVMNKNQNQYNEIKKSDIFNKHGHIKMACPIVIDAEIESEFISNVNIKDEEYQIYIKGIFGLLTVLRKKTLLFINKPFYDNFMLLLVLANTVTLSLNGLVDTTSPIFSNINTAFTISFTVDLSLKIFAYGFNFFSDIMSIFDTFVVSISLVEMSIGTGKSLSALRSVRILRAFRVLRITRLIRSLNYMKIVMSVVSSVITQFVYIFMLLALFIFIYTLLGMQIFGGALLPESVTGIRQNFDTFFNAVFSVFQLLTVENWNDIETAIMASTSVSYFGIIYIISWIFIGNWILLNLLQAILLDGFDKDSSPDKAGEQEEQDEQAIESPPDADETLSKTSEKLEKEDIKSKDASLLLFYPDSWIRSMCIQISESYVFKDVIMVIIIALSSIKLVVDTYIDAGTQIYDISQKLDIAFNCVFVFECVVKIIARGMIIGEAAYLKDNWSKLDFFIVGTGIANMFVAADLSIFKLFRILRPLRIVSKNVEIRIIISSLVQSMCGILNVMVIILCVFLMFGILGINLLQNKLQFCNPTSQLSVGSYGPYNTNQQVCQASGGVWTTQFINFDNILNSLISLYVFSTRENWPYYVFTFIDSSDQGPVRDQSQLLFMVFAVVFIFVCSYFFMDLLVGVLFMNFHEAELKEKPKQLTDKQINWQNLQKIIISEDPCFQLYLQPDNMFRKFFHRIITWKPFQLFITLCILLNIVAMILNQDDQGSSRDKILSNINFAFSILFLSQMVLKLLAFSKAYFLSGWNIFDFFVVMASVLDIILGYAGINNNQSSALSILPQIARIFRVLRVTRLLRMFKRFKGLQKLIQTFIFSLPALGRGLSIVCLFLFISSILASYLFSHVSSDYAGSFTEFRNFKNFHTSIQALFVMTSGENWYYYMFETILPGYIVCDANTSCVSMGYLPFWLFYMFLSQKVFMELFVLIVLDQFESNYIQQNNPLGIFSLFEDDFRTNWIEITTKYSSQKIETKRLLDLLLVLKQPLGMGKRELMSKYEEELRENDKMTQEQIRNSLKDLDLKLKKNAAKLIQKMDIVKNRLYLSYYETFYRFAKMALMPEYMNKATNQQKIRLQQIHKESEKELLKHMPKGNNYEIKEGEDQQPSNEGLNPIELILFSQMIIKSWYNYSLKFHSEKEKKKNVNEANDSLNNSCSSDVEEAALEKLPVERKMQKRRGMLEVGGGMQEAIYEYKDMPNIDDHYQNEKKRMKKGNNSSNCKAALRLSSINALQRFTSSFDKKTEEA